MLVKSTLTSSYGGNRMDRRYFSPAFPEDFVGSLGSWFSYFSRNWLGFGTKIPISSLYPWIWDKLWLVCIHWSIPNVNLPCGHIIMKTLDSFSSEEVRLIHAIYKNARFKQDPRFMTSLAFNLVRQKLWVTIWISRQRQGKELVFFSERRDNRN